MANKEITNVGLTIPFEVVSKLRYLHHISALLLPSGDLDFTDFVMIALHSMLHGLFSPVVELPFDDAVFYSIRVPVRVKESVMEKVKSPISPYFKGSEEVSIRYGAKRPPTFNNIVKSKFTSLLTSEGTLTLLSYVLFIKSTLLILREELSLDEINGMIRFGNFPKIPGFYRALQRAIELTIYISLSEIDASKYGEYRKRYATDEEWQKFIVQLTHVLSSYHSSREEDKKKEDPTYVPSSEKLYNANWTGVEIGNISHTFLSLPALSGLVIGMRIPETGGGRYGQYQLPDNIADLISIAYNLNGQLTSTHNLTESIEFAFRIFQNSWSIIVSSIELQSKATSTPES